MTHTTDTAAARCCDRCKRDDKPARWESRHGANLCRDCSAAFRRS